MIERMGDKSKYFFDKKTVIIYDDGEYEISTQGKVFTLTGGPLMHPLSFYSLKKAKDMIRYIEGGVVVPDEMVHLTPKDLGEVAILDPKYYVPSAPGLLAEDIRFKLGFAYEDELPGISFSSGIEEALDSGPFYFEQALNVYTPVEEKPMIVDPEVFGAIEFKSIEPVAVRKIGIIETKGVCNEPFNEIKTERGNLEFEWKNNKEESKMSDGGLA